ncbi:U4/U6.U5 tri-snRNP-associated protein snu66 [Neolecta irregularis DAH-3]|uniref:U4/U6.U5 tri-snRNP-associated protein snu66 n=1 Tax=Neolecta irregularis (strain DAH-3) TaxID=1198029 RepID=A0A1U7LHL1_NEOID|nr:U4/U6.U5 tri-snRNP-associated protein snu66 [Neolecta irregularis DAH-3]|eukprot:OLL22145.1 U4/U6.U5 tri-snRNP-associated protein snu66 [Neolecta irregularis DAH-3]
MSIVDHRHSSPENDLSHGESLSIQETNKIRASLGLKPLGVPLAEGFAPPPGSSAAQDLEAVENFARVKEQEKADAQKAIIQENIQRQEGRINRNGKLKGKTLGEEMKDEDVMQWIKKSKKKERELALKKENELEEQDKMFQEYSIDQLQGLKVGHDTDDFGIGRDTILTLKDVNILQDEGDELVSEQILERERHERNIENKKKKTVYMGYEEADEETGETRLLSKYDEDKQEKGFVLGNNVPVRKKAQEQPEHQGKTVFSLAYPAAQEVSDYAPVKFKKSKKTTSKRRRRESSVEDMAEVVVSAKRNLDDESFVDDEDLGARLGERRLAALKRLRVLEDAAFAPVGPDWMDIDAGGVVIDETSEFVKGLQGARLSGENGKEEMEEMEESEKEEEMETEVKKEETEPEPEPDSVMDEPVLDQGIGATLRLLQSKGIVPAENADAADQARRQRARDAWLVGQRARQAQIERERREQREAERLSGRFCQMSAKERELQAQAENRQREAAAGREQAELYRFYQPQLELAYVDGFGRRLEGKAAFKYFSHQFHGKDSGKAKTARQLQRMADTSRSARMAATDQPGGIGASLAVRQKKTGEAGMRVL